jgi:hypothetical protein
MTAERVTNNGPIRIIDRLATMTIYLDTTPNAFQWQFPLNSSIKRERDRFV